jgi:hypothetical protein
MHATVMRVKFLNNNLAMCVGGLANLAHCRGYEPTIFSFIRRRRSVPPGTDVMIFKRFSPKNSAKKLAFLTQNKAKLCKNLIITSVFEKNANFFAENWEKSQKIVIITSVPDWEGSTKPLFTTHNRAETS